MRQEAERCELLCLDLPHAEAVRAQLPSPADISAAAERAKALADETRLRIALALQAGGEMCGCDLAWVCGLAQNLVSHHLRALRRAGLADSRRAGKLVMYRLTDVGAVLLGSLSGRQATDAGSATGR
ncbi:metalloregulator ArsR/SmtB family transcription factor [Nonomuraea bangladeshensis]|uniref:Metalloregulator ArsR/SmtB family transcription factor n=1 Tax=Nonomuraea bangladeshensis TaxID=404385 RepID=A0ABV3H0B0_9ACTN